MLGPPQVQHIIPWPYSAKKDGKGPNWSPFWPPLAFPLRSSHWFLLLGILWGGHGDCNKLTIFHHTKSSIKFFHNVKCLF
jgi:hypothetical protein